VSGDVFGIVVCLGDVGRQAEDSGIGAGVRHSSSPEGGFRLGARPGGRELLCKNHEAASFHPGGPPELRNGLGMRIEKLQIRNPQLNQILSADAFATNLFPRHHDRSIPEMSNSAIPPAEAGVQSNIIICPNTTCGCDHSPPGTGRFVR
jgi:hypothetical protein